MLTLEKCLAIARGKKRNINYCTEYTNAYAFGFDGGTERDGGDSPVVVMKDTGETLNMSAYIWTPNKEYVGTRGIE